MHQTAYKGITTIPRLTDYIGGICQWWYTAVENIDEWPVIDPLTQEYLTAPTLVEGASWLGPVRVPNSKLGFDEKEKRTAAGRYFEISIEAFHPGDERASRVNMQNMGYHRYIIVAKQRSGGFYLLFGTPNSPLTFLNNYNSGKGANATPGSEFEFKTEIKHKTPGLAEFDDDISTPPNSSVMNDSEIIPFADVDEVTVEWNTTRKNRFGSFPEIEVWIDESPGGEIYKENSNIRVDAAPPATTQFTIHLTGNATGWIVLK